MNNYRPKWSSFVSLLLAVFFLAGAGFAAEADQTEAQAAFIMPVPAGEHPPALTADGYLESSEPYVFASRDEGQWSYVSRDIRVEIREKTDEDGKYHWFEAFLRYRDPAWFGAMVNQLDGIKPGTKKIKLQYPLKIAEDYNAVFAISDDFFGYRLLGGQKAGIVIRNGYIWSEKTKTVKKQALPPLDILALYADGSMKTFASDAHTAQEYLDMGVVSTFAFGPVLVENGTLCEDLGNWSDTALEPRMAMGIAEDGTVIAVDALGRRKDAKGVSLQWAAEKMLDLGAVEAINLDGGFTTCMIFMGDAINRAANATKKNFRTVTSLIGVREGGEP